MPYKKRYCTRLLVRRAQAGDEDAFTSLYDAYVERIYRYSYFRVANDGCAEDIPSQGNRPATGQTTWRGSCFTNACTSRLAKFLELEVEQVYGR
jgi:hypothetical protein